MNYVSFSGGNKDPIVMYFFFFFLQLASLMSQHSASTTWMIMVQDLYVCVFMLNRMLKSRALHLLAAELQNKQKSCRCEH